MITRSDDLLISFEIDGEVEFEDMRDISILPRVGDEVACDYVQGKKIYFEVTAVRHHLSSMAEGTLHQVTVKGRRLL